MDKEIWVFSQVYDYLELQSKLSKLAQSTYCSGLIKNYESQLSYKLPLFLRTSGLNLLQLAVIILSVNFQAIFIDTFSCLLTSYSLAHS